MDTKWKDISGIFKGLVSFVSMLAFLFLTLLFPVCGGIRIVQLFAVLYDPWAYLKGIISSSVPYIAAGAVLYALLLVPALVFRKERKIFIEALAGLLGKIWVEIKLIFILGFAALLLSVYTYDPSKLAAAIAALIFLIYLICIDVAANRRFFSHNIIHSVLKCVNSWKGYAPYEKRSLRRLYSCLAACAVIAIPGYFLIEVSFYQYTTPLCYIGIFLCFLAVFIWYTAEYKKELRDLTQILEQINRLYTGDTGAVNGVLPGSALYPSAAQLNSVRVGMQRAVDEAVRSEKMKVELITNVSHDLKTPLTSIISYVDILKKEPDLPEHVMDYVNTIALKADRLSGIVSDVFDISKAATGNITLNPEDIDLARLIRQTYAEMQEALEKSKLEWRFELPEEPVIIHADGQRLYRVFQNLFKNCAQYSLDGSRVYVKLKPENGMAAATVRNISRAELKASGEELTSRFVRGDENRTTEGSGLGLSIAKTFTEACGGSFSVLTDGDIFTAVVKFRTVQVPQPEQSVSKETEAAGETA